MADQELFLIGCFFGRPECHNKPWLLILYEPHGHSPA